MAARGLEPNWLLCPARAAAASGKGASAQLNPKLEPEPEPAPAQVPASRSEQRAMLFKAAVSNDSMALQQLFDADGIDLSATNSAGKQWRVLSA